MEIVKVASKLIVTGYIIMTLSGCAGKISPEGGRIMVVDSFSSDLVNVCKKLGSITGYSKLGWGNAVALKQASVDARNKAGKITGADTMAIASELAGFSGAEISAFVYNCSQKELVLIKQVPDETNVQKLNQEIFLKAKKCQKKDGVWFKGQCVISLE